MSGLEGIDGLFAACGGRFPVRVSISADGREPPDERLLERPFLIVGRSPACDIRFDDPAISHRHAYIQPIGRQFFCADLGSRTGVRWHDGPHPAGWLAADETLRIGRYDLKLSLPTPDAIADAGYDEAGIETGVRSSTGGRTDLTLRFLNARFAADRSRRWRIRRNVTLLGHLPTCHIPLSDGSVSRVHASLLKTPIGLWVIDLLGKDGVDLNGQRVPYARLVAGDVLRIGRFRMSIEPTEPGAIVESGRSLVVPDETFHTQESLNSGRADGHGEATGRQKSEGLSEEFVMSMLNQSASMQQQMLTQQNQMILLTMQMLSSMHNQNIDLVRDELDYVRSLTEEIQQIQAKLAGHGPRLISEPTVPPSLTMHSDTTVNGSPAADSTVQRTKPPSPANNGTARATAAAQVNGAAQINGAQPANGVVAKPNEAEVTGAAKPGLNGTELQSHLAHRLAELERKRSGYWKRIVRVVMG